MKKPLHPYRAAVVAAGSFLGLASVVALATPASAHAPAINASTSCIASGGWKADWIVANDWRTPATITDIVLDGKHVDSVGGITKNATVAPYESQWLHGSSTETDSSAQLHVYLTWSDGYRADATKAAYKPRHCSSPSPSKSSPCPSKGPSQSPSQSPSKSPSQSPSSSPSASGRPSASPSDSASPSKSPSPSGSASPPPSATTSTPAAAVPTPTSTGGGGLALTGASAGPIGGGAAGVLAVGGLLFFLARRRKVKFTA